jgi:hypothetical protein
MVRVVSTKMLVQAHGAGALLDALEHFFAVALALALRRHGQGRHFGGSPSG